MPGASRLGDKSTGHGAFPPRPNDQASPNVFINGIPAHRQGDHWITHCAGPVCHDSTLAAGAPHVFTNGKQASRIGDPIVCGDRIATGSTNVFIGNFGGGGGTQSGPATWGTIQTQWETEPNTWEQV